MAKVAVIYSPPPYTQDTLVDMVREALEKSAAGSSLLKDIKNSTVLIKPNLFAPLLSPATTDPKVISALIIVLSAYKPNSILIGDSRSISTFKFRAGYKLTAQVANYTGLLSELEELKYYHHNISFVGLEETEQVEIELPKDSVVLKSVKVPKILLDADVLINIPSLKIHSLTQVTLGIKNLHGIVSDEYKLFAHNYRQLPDKLSDLLLIKPPKLTLIAGLSAQEYDHAEDGNAVPMGVILASNDTVAADTVGAYLMGYEEPVSEIELIKAAHNRGLGVGSLKDIEIVGEQPKYIRKNLMKPDISLEAIYQPYLVPYLGDYCRACLYYSRRGVDKLYNESILEKLGCRLHLFIGKEPPLGVAEIRKEDKVVIHGDCAINSESLRLLKYKLWLEDKLIQVFGCPPMEFRKNAIQLLTHQ